MSDKEKKVNLSYAKRYYSKYFDTADTSQTDEFKNFDREDLILLIECQKEQIRELLADKDTPQTDWCMTEEQAEDYRKMLDKAEHKVYGNIADTPQSDCSWK